MDLRLLLQGTRHPERLEGGAGDELEQLLQTLPAFEAGQLLNLKRLKAHHSSRLPSITDRTAAAAAQGQWVYRALHPTEAIEPGWEVDVAQAVPSTRLAWYEKLAGLDSETEEEDLLALGYAEALAGDLLEADATLDAWMAGSLAEERTSRMTEPLSAEKTGPGTDSLRDLAALSLNTNEIPVSESLAELHLRQGQRQRAAQIYRKLMLRFPAKTTYFAARLEQIQSDNDS
jgi:hypothetical protein